MRRRDSKEKILDVAVSLAEKGGFDRVRQREVAASDDFDPQLRWRSVQAKVLARRGEFEEAETLSREALAIAAGTDWHRMHADALVDLAEVLRLAGRADETAQALREAIELYERKQDLADAKRARSELATLLG